MNQRVAAVVLVTSLLAGVLGVVYGLPRTKKELPTFVYVEAAPTDTQAATVAPARYDELMQQVAPPSGITLAVKWDDMGQKLIASGAIDLDRFQTRYAGLNGEQHAILLGDDLTEITLTPENIQFWTNVLWALGLVQESKVLGEGPIKQYEATNPLGGYASTGGWTLGSRPTVELYNSARLIDLTPEQDDLVYRVAEHVFRPCCGNHTAFPDCNHGMAVLGLLELMASQGAAEDELYQAALAFNAYAFSDTYIRVAAYFARQDISWSDVSPRVALGPEYSSAQGARRVASIVGPIDGMPGQGGSCGA